MDITAFSTGTDITIYIPIMDKMIPALCKVIGPREQGIMVTQPKYKGVPLNEMHDFSFSIHDKDFNRYNFRCSLIRPIPELNNMFYYMEGLQGIDPRNYRRAERYPVGIMGVAHSGVSKDVHVVIYDISMRGISFAMEREAVFRLGEDVTVVFQEKEHNKHLNIQASIVRKFSLDEYEAVGCKMHNLEPDVMAFINWLKEQHTTKEESQDLT
ncbi:MAG: PilZ domain-containing protein [Butyrivibrio sp.]|uniref:PilZ domain-containing protein n=1 Tax=Butyrivibrio sp. TaxID=28121 RepID=UPI0025F4625A|nr:PilZ domain-containing protein [Butyrivibrio sp.]MCR5770835.1 PilZ domain-containing protein [Butyrivibrio sp.]